MVVISLLIVVSGVRRLLGTIRPARVLPLVPNGTESEWSGIAIDGEDDEDSEADVSASRRTIGADDDGSLFDALPSASAADEVEAVLESSFDSVSTGVIVVVAVVVVVVVVSTSGLRAGLLLRWKKVSSECCFCCEITRVRDRVDG